MNIEERIAQHARMAALGGVGGLTGTYLVSPPDFLDMADRLGTKVTYGAVRVGPPEWASMEFRVGAIALTVIAGEGIAVSKFEREAEP